MTTPKRRIYIARHTDTGTERLIRAASAPQARNHAARDTITVSLATQERLIALLTAEPPVQVEDVDAEPASAPVDDGHDGSEV